MFTRLDDAIDPVAGNESDYVTDNEERWPACPAFNDGTFEQFYLLRDPDENVLNAN